MKLLSLNVEGSHHTDRVFPFITKEDPDVICLQEVQQDTEYFLQESGYVTSFLPMNLRRNSTNELVQEGILLAAKQAFSPESFYYYKPQEKIQEFDHLIWRNTNAQGMIHANFMYDDAQYTLATTHFTWTPNGQIAGSEQIADMEIFSKYVTSLPPHVMCGDFNIPRNINSLYNELTKCYTDVIPEEYASSLDKNLHHLGTEKDKSIIFDSFMVDYVFTQPPYHASDVKLIFNVSDHAAVVATITQ